MNDLMGLITTNYEIGDFGTLTSERPSAALPFGGRYRLIDFPLSNMVNSGIHIVGLITPHMYRSLMDHVGVGKEWDLDRKIEGLYILPGSVYGLKGARGKYLIRDLRQNMPFLERGGKKRVVICDASKICNIDFSEVERDHVAAGRDITLIYKKGLYTEGNKELYLNISSRERVTDITAGANRDGNCFLDAFIIELDLLLKIIDWYEHMSYMDLLEIFAQHLSDFNIGSYCYDGYVGVINDLKSYMDVSADLLNEDVRKHLFSHDNPILTKVQDSPPAKYIEGSSVTSSMIASGSIIEGTVENSIIFRDVHIGKNSTVKNCVLMQHCEVAENVFLENIICDKYVTIKPNVKLSASADSPMAISKRQRI